MTYNLVLGNYAFESPNFFVLPIFQILLFYLTYAVVVVVRFLAMLISFFQGNECLWNHNSPSYHENTRNKDLLYDMLVKELDDKYDSTQIKKKWKELEKKF